MSRPHALLGASSAARWIACPPSARLQEQYADRATEYAEQGTDAHALAEWKLHRLLGDSAEARPNLSYFDDEMDETTDQYASYIEEILTGTTAPFMCVEQRVDYSRWVPEGFGTADAIIVGEGKVTICDFKYGTGVEVDAKDNPQLSCYALGALEIIDGLYEVSEVTMVIFQPRRENISTWTIPKEQLLKWAETVLRPAAELAIKGEGTFKCGDHCRFCKAKHECRARSDEQLQIMKYDFALPPILTDDEIVEILGKVDKLTQWAEDVKSYALDAAIGGKCWEGYKLVEGRSNRKFTDEEAVAEKVIATGKNPFERKLLGITAMTQLLGTKRFNELLGEFVVKPKGKATLVPVSDKRPAMDNTDFIEGE